MPHQTVTNNWQSSMTSHRQHVSHTKGAIGEMNTILKQHNVCTAHLKSVLITSKGVLITLSGDPHRSFDVMFM